MSTERRRKQTERMVADMVAKGTRKPWWKRAGAMFVGVATVLGFAVTLLSLFSRLSVINASAINPLEPFSSPFTVSNDGLLPIRRVRVGCGLGKIITSRHSDIIGLPDFSVVLQQIQMTAAELDPSEKYTVSFDSGFKIPEGGLTDADIAVVVSYQSHVLPFLRRQQRFRFITHKGADDRLYWFSQPFSK